MNSVASQSSSSGWDGGSPTTVTVVIKNMGPNDRLTVEGPAGTLNFGTVSLQQNYSQGTRDFTGSTITMLGNTVTIVLGIPSGAVNTVTVASPTTWQGDNGAYDASGNACTTATITGSGSPRIDF